MRAMVDLAIRYGEGSVLLKNVAKRQMVSLKYLEQLITPLRAAGLVRGVRGARGGYTLAKDPSEISLSEIVNALEGPPAPVECVHDSTTCAMMGSCATHNLWDRMYLAVNRILENETLADLAQEQIDLNQKKSNSNMFFI